MDEILSGNFVTIAPDKMSVTINLASPNIGTEYTVSDVIELLGRHDVKQGIDKEKIKEIIDERLYYQDHVVAKGKSSSDGKDGYYIYHFRTEVSIKPKMLPNGSVDFKNMDLFEQVKEKQLIAEYVPATPGEYGYTVFGDLLKPHKGKSLPTLRGRGFVMSEDKTKYYSSMDGIIVLDGNRMEVLQIYTVEGDVDFTVGNIDFNGDVYVKGSVQSGYHIHASGNIVIEGHVEAAEICAGKSLLLKQGVQGNNAGFLSATDTVSGMFFESAKIVAGKNITGNYILNCEAITDGKIVVAGKKGVIIGGRVRATSGISCFGIGNVAEIPTKIEVGIDSSQFEKHQELGKQILKVESEIKQFEEGIKKASSEASTRVVALRSKLIQALDMKNKEREELLTERTELLEKLNACRKASVSVKGIVYPGVTIVIDMSSFLVTTPYKTVVFVRNGREVLLLKE